MMWMDCQGSETIYFNDGVFSLPFIFLGEMFRLNLNICIEFSCIRALWINRKRKFVISLVFFFSFHFHLSHSLYILFEEWKRCGG